MFCVCLLDLLSACEISFAWGVGVRAVDLPVFVGLFCDVVGLLFGFMIVIVWLCFRVWYVGCNSVGVLTVIY